MPRYLHIWCALVLPSMLGSFAAAADRPLKQTHVLQVVAVEVAFTRSNGNPWDTGIGNYARPDPQVTLLRHDQKALAEATDLMVQAMVKKFEELGRPMDPRLKKQLPSTAMQSLQCGHAVAALQSKPLMEARNKFAADTTMASDTFTVKPVDGGLRVALGDKVTIFVNDIDFAAHDTMGQVDVDITKELIAKGELELKFNDVKSLTAQIKRIGK